MQFVFFGTDDFSVAILEKLISDFYRPALVISQPDKPVGRKQELTPPPIKHVCDTHGLPLLQPQRTKDALAAISELKPDVFIVASFGQIIPQALLDVPKSGAINVHTSLLPRFRGASPIQAAILSGDEKTGITIMLMDAELDHGPILHQSSIQIGDRETMTSLRARLATVGADTLCKILPDYLRGRIQAKPQNHAVSTTTTLIQKDDARLDWTMSCVYADRMVRAYESWPWAWTILPNGKRMKIFSATYTRASEDAAIAPGTIKFTQDTVAIACSDGWLLPHEMQVEGKEPLMAAAFARGYHSLDGQICPVA